MLENPVLVPRRVRGLVCGVAAMVPHPLAPAFSSASGPGVGSGTRLRSILSKASALHNEHQDANRSVKYYKSLSPEAC